MTARRFPPFAALFLSWACTTDPNLPVAPAESQSLDPGIQAAPPGFSLVDLGILAGGTQSGAWSINDRGDVVGLADDSTGTARAIYVPWGGPMIQLPSFYPNASAEAFDLNKRLAVGWSSDKFGAQRAAVWKVPYTINRLKDLGGSTSVARAINDRNEITGWATTPGGDYHAVRWDATGTITDLGTLGSTYSQAYDINDAGTITGCSILPTGQAHAFIWDPVLLMQDIGPAGSAQCGNAINNAGWVVGEWRTSSPQGVTWAGGSWTIHWSLRTGTSSAADVNDPGWAVGYLIPRTGGTRAYVRSPAGVNSLLPNLPGGPASQATSINTCGKVVGWGTNASYQSRAVLWDTGC